MPIGFAEPYLSIGDPGASAASQPLRRGVTSGSSLGFEEVGVGAEGGFGGCVPEAGGDGSNVGAGGDEAGCGPVPQVVPSDVGQSARWTVPDPPLRHGVGDHCRELAGALIEDREHRGIVR